MRLQRLVILLVCVVLLLPTRTLAQDPLTESFTSTDGEFSFNYPANWSTSEIEKVVALVNNERLLGSVDVRTGEIAIIFFRPDDLNGRMISLSYTTADVVDELARSVIPVDSETEATQTATVNDLPASIKPFVSPNSEGTIYAIDMPFGILGAVLLHHEREGAAAESIFLAVVQTVRYGVLQQPTPTSVPRGAEVLWQIAPDDLDIGAVLNGAVSSDGAVFVADLYALQMVTADGKVRHMITPDVQSDVTTDSFAITGVEVSPDGELWIVGRFSTDEYAAFQLDLDGNPLQKLTLISTDGNLADIRERFWMVDIAFDAEGNIVLAGQVYDENGNNPLPRIQYYTADGEFIFETTPTDTSNFQYDVSVAIDDAIYLFDEGRSVLTTFSLFGEEMETFQPNGISAITLVEDGIVMVNSNTLTYTTRTGEITDTIDLRNLGLVAVSDLSFFSNGDVLLVGSPITRIRLH